MWRKSYGFLRRYESRGSVIEVSAHCDRARSLTYCNLTDAIVRFRKYESVGRRYEEVAAAGVVSNTMLEFWDSGFVGCGKL